MKKYKKGFTAGTFDMFHIGHLNLLTQAKEYCDYLIVGVNSDDLVVSYKSKKPVINEKNRLKIVSAIRYVDEAFLSDTLDKITAYKRFGFDVVFIGDDWKGSKRWNDTEKALKKIGVDVIYLPYTQGISSTLLRDSVNCKAR